MRGFIVVPPLGWVARMQRSAYGQYLLAMLNERVF